MAASIENESSSTRELTSRQNLNKPSSNSVFVQNYTLNILECIKKQINATYRTNISIICKGGGLVLKFNSGFYEVFKRCANVFYSNLELQSNVNISVTDNLDKQKRLTGTVSKIQITTNGETKSYTLNMYNTQCSALVNGRLQNIFISDHLNSILDLINIDEAQKFNITVRETFKNVIRSNHKKDHIDIVPVSIELKNLSKTRGNLVKINNNTNVDLPSTTIVENNQPSGNAISDKATTISSSTPNNRPKPHRPTPENMMLSLVNIAPNIESPVYLSPINPDMVNSYYKSPTSTSTMVFETSGPNSSKSDTPINEKPTIVKKLFSTESDDSNTSKKLDFNDEKQDIDHITSFKTILNQKSSVLCDSTDSDTNDSDNNCVEKKS